VAVSAQKPIKATRPESIMFRDLLCTQLQQQLSADAAGMMKHKSLINDAIKTNSNDIHMPGPAEIDVYAG